MADYYATARTNYFAVLDPAELQQALTPIGLSLERQGDLVAIVVNANEHPNGWPDGYLSEEGDWIAVNVAALVADHLSDGHVAIFLEAGAEKSRYVIGEATAVNSDGEIRRINLNDIYDAAAELGDHVTKAEY